MTFFNYKEAKSNPCHKCLAGCCTYLPLKDVQVTNLMELDHLYYLLHFEGIDILLVDGQTWRVHYSARCDFLTEENLCTLHNTTQKPNICTTYNPYHCFYKPAFLGTETIKFIRINLERLAFFSDYIRFDADRNITHLPNLTEIFPILPPFEKSEPVQKTSLPLQEPIQQNLSVEQIRQPCSNCQSYCCNTLHFPMQSPTHISNFDYFRFCTGYPNVFVVFHDNQWSVNVKTSCKNYDASTSPFHCSVFGKEERPLQCSVYNELKCEFKKR